MKFNLKNRPHRDIPSEKVGWTKWKQCLEWFEGFEKELREILKFATMYKLPSDYPRDAKLIIKILGDGKE